MRLVDYQNKTWEEIENFNTELRKEHYYEITGFWNIADLWREISLRIPCVRKCFAVFNGKFIILDKGDSLEEDDVYKFITGKTRLEKELDDLRWLEEYKRKEREWKAKIPTLIPAYVEKMKKVTEEKYHYDIEKCVHDCLDSIYHEYLVEALIELLEFSKNKSFEEIEKKIDEQGHSSNTYGIIMSMFRHFSDSGEKYCKWCENKQGVNR